MYWLFRYCLPIDTANSCIASVHVDHCYSDVDNYTAFDSSASGVSPTTVKLDTDDFCLLSDYEVNVVFRDNPKAVDNVVEFELSTYDKLCIFNEHSYCYTDTLNIYSLNVCGLNTKLLCDEFFEHVLSFDICCFQECKTDGVDEISIRERFSDYGYEIFFNHRKKLSKSRSGGVAMVMKKNIFDKCVILQSSITDVLWVLLKLDTNMTILIGNIYVPPMGSRFFNHNVFESIELEIISFQIDYGIDYVCLNGDFNARTNLEKDFVNLNHNIAIHNEMGMEIVDDLNMEEHFDCLNLHMDRNNSDNSKTNFSGRELISLCKNQSLLIANGRVGHDKHLGNYTTKNKSVIDYVIMSPGLLAKVLFFEIDHFDPIFSDVHKAIDYTIKFAKNPPFSKSSNGGPKEIPENTENVRVSWNTIESDEFNSLIEQSGIDELNELCKDLETDDLLAIFNEKMMGLYEKSNMIRVNCRKSCRNNKNYFNKNCRLSRKKYNISRKKYKDNKTDDNYETLKVASHEYKKELRKAHYDYKKKCRKKIKSSLKNPKEYWKLLNYDVVHNEVKASMNSLYEHFSKLNVTNNFDEFQENSDVKEYDTSYLDSEISIEEIKRSFSSLKNGKSPGDDRILNEFLKATFPFLESFYLRLFNNVLESGQVPNSWNSGVIIPIFKGKGDPKDPSNYRGITLVSSLGKAFTKIINNRLEKFSEKYNIINENQAGFRSDRSTIDQIFVLQNLIDMALSEKRKIYVAWVDFRKAFDSVNRSALFCKMINEGISGKIVNLVKNMYRGVQSRVFSNGVFSQYFISSIGLKQGECLSGFLFSLFINDLEQFLKSGGYEPILVTNKVDANDFLRLFLVLFADDLALLADSPEKLQCGLDSLEKYCDLWGLNVNIQKTKITVFEKFLSDEQNRVYLYKNHKIEVVQYFTYLGLKLSYDGSMKNCIKQLCDQGSKAVFSVLKKSRVLGLHIDTVIDLFHKLVLPVISYGCEVWGFENLDILDKFHLKFLRFVLKLRKGTPNMMIYGETGEIPISIIIKTRMFGYFCKLINPMNISLAKNMFDLTRSLHVNRLYSSRWLRGIVKLLADVEKSNLLNVHMKLNHKTAAKACKSILKGNFLKLWNDVLSVSSKCDQYYLYKNSHDIEKYLRILPPQLAIELCRFRTSNHKLEVETLRYVRPLVPRIDRKCTKCNLNETGNELHCLLVCPAFRDIRNKYIDLKFTNRVSFHKYLNLMSSKSPTVLLHLALFVRESMKVYS